MSRSSLSAMAETCAIWAANIRFVPLKGGAALTLYKRNPAHLILFSSSPAPLMLSPFFYARRCFMCDAMPWLFVCCALVRFAWQKYAYRRIHQVCEASCNIFGKFAPRLAFS